MRKLIDQQAAIEALDKRFDSIPMEQTTEILQLRKDLRSLPSVQLEQDREFMKLTVRNSNGRPYYSIIFLEFDDNGVGHDFEGYSSYSLDVISDYLKKYFMPSVQPSATDTNDGGNLIEMPQVVRCKDCKWWHDWNGECYGNGNTGYGVGRKADDFCSWGERRKNAAD